MEVQTSASNDSVIILSGRQAELAIIISFDKHPRDKIFKANCLIPGMNSFGLNQSFFEELLESFSFSNFQVSPKGSTRTIPLSTLFS